MRRFIYLFIVIGAVILLFIVGYFFRYQGGAVVDLNPIDPISPITPGGIVPGNNNQGNNQVNPIPSGGVQTPTLGIVADKPVLNYFVDSQNNVVIVQPDGQIVEVSAAQATVISSQVVADLREAIFSHDGKMVLAIFGNALNPQVSLFDVAGRSWKPLDLKIQTAAWSPSNYQIVYASSTGDASLITTLNLGDEKAKPQTLLSLRIEDVRITWPEPNKLIFATRASGLALGSLLSYDISKKIITPVILDQSGLQFLWSPSSSEHLVFVAGARGYGGGISSVDSLGNSLGNIGLFTLPSKCGAKTSLVPQTISNSTSTTSTITSSPQGMVVCGAPKNYAYATGQIMPDSYEQKEFFTYDDIYEINLRTGESTRIFSPQLSIDVSRVTSKNDLTFFVNRLNERLYVLSLPQTTPQ